MFDSTIELSVSATSKRSREVLWQKMQRFARDLSESDASCDVHLTANDCEDFKIDQTHVFVR